MGRVDPAAAADPAAYGFWTGSDWVGGEAAATVLTLAGAQSGYAVKPSVRYLADRKLWILADASGFGSGTISLRLARAQQGPWGPATTVVPADCTGTYPRQCLGVEIHPQFGDDRSLAVT